MKQNALTDALIRQAKKGEKRIRLTDGRGLYLEISPTTGSKFWRFKYYFQGKEKRLALGVYPDVSLQLARERREEARQVLARGIDPSALKSAQKEAVRISSSNTFELVAREWFKRFKGTWADSHAKTVIRRLEKDIFPWLGDRVIGEITAPELLAVIRQVEN